MIDFAFPVMDGNDEIQHVINECNKDNNYFFR